MLSRTMEDKSEIVPMREKEENLAAVPPKMSPTSKKNTRYLFNTLVECVGKNIKK